MSISPITSNGRNFEQEPRRLWPCMRSSRSWSVVRKWCKDELESETYKPIFRHSIVVTVKKFQRTGGSQDMMKKGYPHPGRPLEGPVKEQGEPIKGPEGYKSR
jgi:hypothetical protein